MANGSTRRPLEPPPRAVASANAVRGQHLQLASATKCARLCAISALGRGHVLLLEKSRSLVFNPILDSIRRHGLSSSGIQISNEQRPRFPRDLALARARPGQGVNYHCKLEISQLTWITPRARPLIWSPRPQTLCARGANKFGQSAQICSRRRAAKRRPKDYVG